MISIANTLVTTKVHNDCHRFWSVRALKGNVRVLYVYNATIDYLVQGIKCMKPAVELIFGKNLDYGLSYSNSIIACSIQTNLTITHWLSDSL